MRLCILGSSHVGALRMAWGSGLHLPPLSQLTFFAQRGGKVKELCVDNGRLVPNSEEQRQQIMYTSGGRDSVDPDLYDAFLLYGLGRQPSLTEDGSLYSRAVAEAATLDPEHRSGLQIMVRRLREITRKPIFVAQPPLPADVDGNPLPPPLLPYDEIIRLLDSTVYAPLGARLVPQPAETIVQGQATAAHWGKGSWRLDVGVGAEQHTEEDRTHMNSDYGRVWLTRFAESLAVEGPFDRQDSQPAA